jgi:hypothetical protein
MTIGRFVNAEWRQARHHPPGALRKTAGFQKVEGLGGDERCQDAEHRHIDDLSSTGGFALSQRSKNSDDAEYGRKQVRNGNAHSHWRVGWNSEVIINPLSALVMLSMAFSGTVGFRRTRIGFEER